MLEGYLIQGRIDKEVIVVFLYGFLWIFFNNQVLNVLDIRCWDKGSFQNFIYM